MIRARRSGALIAICVAYALSIQGLMASVGLGMSAAAASGQADFVICSSVHLLGAQAPNEQPAPNSQPQCPFCFVAAQSAGHAATIANATAFPAYAGLQLAGALAGDIDYRTSVPAFRRTVGDPRAPPRFSV